jgi:signal transduction histidine kinase
MVKKLTSKIEEIGLAPNMSFDEIRRVRISNKLLLIALVSTLLFSISDIFTGLYIPVITLSFTSLIILFCFFITSKGFSSESSFLAVVTAATAITINAYVINADVGISFILLSLIGVPVVNMDLKRKGFVSFTISYISILFLGSTTIKLPFLAIYNITPELTQQLYIGALIQSVILVISQVFFFLREMNFRFKNQQEQHEKMMMQSRMSDIGLMSAGIAHEINNPLTIIKSYASKLQQQCSIPPEKIDQDKNIEYIEKIDQQVGRITKIIRGIRYLSRDYENVDFEKLEVSHIITNIDDIFKERLKNLGIQFDIDMQNPHFMIRCKGAQIEQVLVSLLSNAIDAVKNVEKPIIKLRTSVENSYLTIYVEDNGHGISKEDAPHIMTTFFSTKPTGKGTGMGLSIAKSIIENHQGQLTIDSLMPTRFKISLPLIKS